MLIGSIIDFYVGGNHDRVSMTTDSIIVLKPSSAFARARAEGKEQYTSASFNGGFTDAPIVIAKPGGHVLASPFS